MNMTITIETGELMSGDGSYKGKEKLRAISLHSPDEYSLISHSSLCCGPTLKSPNLPVATGQQSGRCYDIARSDVRPQYISPVSLLNKLTPLQPLQPLQPPPPPVENILTTDKVNILH